MMSKSTTETIRARYRPPRIAVLFVGESPPANGAFFYSGRPAMTQYMEQALTRAGLTGEGDFLDHFQRLGWFLDDLVLSPVDHLSRSERTAQCRAAVTDLSKRIREYDPQAVVTVLQQIDPIVRQALKQAGSKAAYYVVPFPGQGHQQRFLEAMTRILPTLPRC